MRFTEIPARIREMFDVKIYREQDYDEKTTTPPGVTGIYYGVECCPELIPDAELAVSAYLKARATGLTFHLLSPPMLTDAGLANLAESFSGLDMAAGNRGERAEVICNDWGALTAASAFESLEPVLGRFLNGQRTDPRIADLAVRHIPASANPSEQPEKPDDRFEDAALNASLPWMRRFLRSHGIRRVEISPPTEGSEAPPASEFRLSLYYPFTPVAVTRFCQVRDLLSKERASNTGVHPCIRECGGGVFRITHGSIKEELTLSGNAVFSRSKIPDIHGISADRLPDAIDRLVLFETPA